MNLPLLKSEIKRRWTLEAHPDYNQIAAILNAIDDTCRQIDPQIRKSEVVKLLIGEPLGKIAQAAGDPNGDAIKTGLALGFLSLMVYDRTITVADCSEPLAAALIDGLLAYGLITQAHKDAMIALQSVPTSFALYTWGCEVTPTDVVNAMADESPKWW